MGRALATVEVATGFDCRICGKHDNTLPLSFRVKSLATTRLPTDELYFRLVISADQCVSFYLRGHTILPVDELRKAFNLQSGD